MRTEDETTAAAAECGFMRGGRERGSRGPSLNDVRIEWEGKFGPKAE